MIIRLRNKKMELRAKDILDISMDMSIVEKDRKYYVKVNKNYYLDETFEDKKQAEDALIGLSNARNELENELRMYS